MKIGINATCINDRPSGARQRFVGLLTHLAPLMPDSVFVVFEPEDCRMASWFSSHANVITRTTPLKSTGRWQRFFRGLTYWPSVFDRECFDIFEALHMPATRATTGCTLLTIHDVRGLHPETGWLGRQLFRVALRTSLRRADRVVTVSQAMRQEILAFSTSRPVEVIYNGLEVSRFVPSAAHGKGLAGLQLPGRYMLAVGHLEPRKNYRTLVDALALLINRGVNLELVIVGNDSGERAAIESQVATAGLQSHVRLISGLTDDEVRTVYQGAEMLVFPSRYEGFGIPLLEAMASGIPVVASGIPVFREILEDAGFFFDPDSKESIATAVATVLDSQKVREQLIARGKARVKDFDFAILAHEFAAIYERVARLAPLETRTDVAG